MHKNCLPKLAKVPNRSWFGLGLVTLISCFLTMGPGCGGAETNKRKAITGPKVEPSATDPNKASNTRGDESPSPGSTRPDRAPSAFSQTPSGTLSGVPKMITARPNAKIPINFSVVGVAGAQISSVVVAIPDSGIPDQTFPIAGNASAHIEVEVPADLKAGSFAGSLQALGSGSTLLGEAKFEVRINP